MEKTAGTDLAAVGVLVHVAARRQQLKDAGNGVVLLAFVCQVSRLLHACVAGRRRRVEKKKKKKNGAAGLH